MIPHFVVHHQECERCSATLYIGYECIKHDDGYFCDEDCLKNHLLEGSGHKDVYLTDDRIWREID